MSAYVSLSDVCSFEIVMVADRGPLGLDFFYLLRLGILDGLPAALRATLQIPPLAKMMPHLLVETPGSASIATSLLTPL